MIKFFEGRLDIWSGKDYPSFMDYKECVIVPTPFLPKDLGDELRDFNHKRVRIIVELVDT
jgi:hypothetical protein